MEFLQALYQKRLDQLSRLFLKLVQQLQTTVTPFSQPLLAPHKIQYLVHIIVNTLKDQREKQIYRLSQQLQDLRNQVNQDSLLSIKRINRPLVCSKDSTIDLQSTDLSLKLAFPSQMSKTHIKNSSYLEKLSTGDESICESSKSSTKTKNTISQEQWRRQQKSRKSSNSEQHLEDELQFQFKYLRI